jgi:hypothetical protein
VKGPLIGFATLLADDPPGAVTLASLYADQTRSALAASFHESTGGQLPRSINADGQYVTIDATAKDGDGATLLAELQDLGLVAGTSTP